MRRVIFYFSPNEQCGGWGAGYAARLLLLFSFPCSADHERDWPPYFFRVGNQFAECEKKQHYYLHVDEATIFAPHGVILHRRYIFNAVISTSSEHRWSPDLLRRYILMRWYLHHHLDVMEGQFWRSPGVAGALMFFYGRFKQEFK